MQNNQRACLFKRGIHTCHTFLNTYMYSKLSHTVHTSTYSYYSVLFLAGLTTTLTWSSNKLAAAQS